MAERMTHFGFREVDETRKAALVGGVFHSVADKYDLMNDLMSFGVHRLWKRFAIGLTGVRAGQRALDVAAGSGDMALALARRVGPGGLVVASDINGTMLNRGRDRLVDAGVGGHLRFAQADAERLPFAAGSFDCVTIAFGLRNVTRQSEALASMLRCLRVGGRLVILEFSQPRSAVLSAAYDAYSFHILPRVGQLVARDRDSYRYLVESIRKHPDQQTLMGMMEKVGFRRVDYHNLSGGIVAVHVGYRL